MDILVLEAGFRANGIPTSSRLVRGQGEQLMVLLYRNVERTTALQRC
jgi:hypothetical protein